MKNYIYIKLSGFDSVIKEVPNRMVGRIVLARIMRRGLTEDEVKFPAAAHRPEIVRWVKFIRTGKQVN